MKSLLTMIVLTVAAANASAADFQCFCRLDEESSGALSEQNNTTAEEALFTQKRICGQVLLAGNNLYFNFENAEEAMKHGEEIAVCEALK